MSDFKIINGNRGGHRVSPGNQGNYKIAYSVCPKQDPDTTHNMQVRKLTLPLVSSLNGKRNSLFYIEIKNI